MITTPLPIGTPVRVLVGRHQGWTGNVAQHDALTGFYRLRLTHDPRGEAIVYLHRDGPYTRRELEVLTHPQTGHPRPSHLDKDVFFSSEGAA